MKRCIDCKFARYNVYYSTYSCDRLHTSKEVADLVKGGTKTISTTPYSAYRFAEEERASISPFKCGKKARYFQPKPKVPV